MLLQNEKYTSRQIFVILLEHEAFMLAEKHFNIKFIRGIAACFSGLGKCLNSTLEITYSFVYVKQKSQILSQQRIV